MKTRILFLIPALIFTMLSNFSCKKLELEFDHELHHDHPQQGVPYYSTVSEFKDGLYKAASKIQSYQLRAYKDTLSNGKPDINGRKEPLIYFVQAILEKLQGNKVEEAVHDVFHFDGATFSLFSYLMKARMVNDISPATLTSILAEIPLPPVPMAGFAPPIVPVAEAVPIVAVCKCKPKVKIRVTFVYIPDCGNYKKETTGYVVNNKLTNMSSGMYYKIVPEVEGCGCAGTWTHTMTAPAGASYGSGYSGSPANGVNFQGISSGTYTFTFTYTCGCVGCGASDSQTLSISIK